MIWDTIPNGGATSVWMASTILPLHDLFDRALSDGIKVSPTLKSTISLFEEAMKEHCISSNGR